MSKKNKGSVQMPLNTNPTEKNAFTDAQRIAQTNKANKLF